MKHWFSSMLFLGGVVASSQGYAQIDPMIEGAKMCTRHLTRYEREYGIPTHLLSAISSIESGRYHKGLQIRLPWPWAVNVEGKGYMFDSKEEAIAAVRKFRRMGAKSIDVGCMQVNLVHHAGAFTSLEQAFDPEHNIAYAAGFLRGLFQEEGSWKKAAADYHSKTPGLGREYAGQVYNSWFEIIDKLRNARLQTAAAPQQVASSAEAQPALRQVVTETKQPESRSSSNTNPHVRTISVSSAPSRQMASTARDPHDNDVLVINAQPQPMQQNVSPKTIMIAEDTPRSEEAKIIHIDNQQPTIPVVTAAPQSSGGPNFIFRD